ncbi:hypothetical protein ACNHKD_11230 [Methylocystis sp. JAN1]|uniref:hypothetical protein n=1 Tax=Methylocystis sp. JAN1 TaxID=3397211 RepID=UPI003FA1EA8F
MSSAWRKWGAPLALGLALACAARDAATAQFYFRPFVQPFRYDLPPPDVEDDFDAPRFASRRAVARILAREGFQLVGPLGRRGDQIVATGVSRREGETRFFIDPFEGVILHAVSTGAPPRGDDGFVPPLGGSHPVVKEIGRGRAQPPEETRENGRIRSVARPAPQLNAPVPTPQAPSAPIAAPAPKAAPQPAAVKPVETAKPAQPQKPIEWAKPAEISKLGEPPEAPAGPPKAAEAPKPPESAKSIAAKPMEPAKPVKAAKSTEPPKSVELARPAAISKVPEPSKAIEAPKPVAAKPVEPAKPVAARPAAEPAKPVEAAKAPVTAPAIEWKKPVEARVEPAAKPAAPPVTEAAKPSAQAARAPAPRATAARSTGGSHRAIVPPASAESVTVVTPSTPATSTAHSAPGARTPQSVAMPKEQ